MNEKQLPPYFKKYLDSRFDSVLNKIGDVEGKVVSMENSLKQMNGDLVSVKSSTIENEIMRKHKIKEVEELTKIAKSNSRAVRIMAFAFVVGSFVWIKESRDFLISVLLQVIGG